MRLSRLHIPFDARGVDSMRSTTTASSNEAEAEECDRGADAVHCRARGYLVPPSLMAPGAGEGATRHSHPWSPGKTLLGGAVEDIDWGEPSAHGVDQWTI